MSGIHHSAITGMIRALCVPLICLCLLASARGTETKESVVGVYHADSGIETRTLTLLANGNYLARWDGDLASNGKASGTWTLVDGEIHLSPKKEDGAMMRGHFRIMLLKEFEGRRALLRKEDSKQADNPFFHLFLQTKDSHHPGRR
jgi:hypothetical protein